MHVKHVKSEVFVTKKNFGEILLNFKMCLFSKLSFFVATMMLKIDSKNLYCAAKSNKFEVSNLEFN